MSVPFFKRGLLLKIVWVAATGCIVRLILDRLQAPGGLRPVVDALRAVNAKSWWELPYCSTLVALLWIDFIAVAVVFAKGSKAEESPLDAYTLEEPALGEGSFGKVYRATKMVAGPAGGDGPVLRTFAVKLLDVHRLEHANDGIAEAMRLACVDHKNVVGVHEQFMDKVAVSGSRHLFFGETPLRLCIVQELCSGDLEAEISHWASPEDGGFRPRWPELLKIFGGVTEGLGALHARRIIHRDMKPANIFLSADHREVKIGDLGLAETVPESAKVAPSSARKTLSPQQLSSAAAPAQGLKRVGSSSESLALKRKTVVKRKTLSPHQLSSAAAPPSEASGKRSRSSRTEVDGLGWAGTPGYIAPEVWKDKPYSTAADDWSLGCILADMAFPVEGGGWSVSYILEEAGYTLDDEHELDISLLIQKSDSNKEEEILEAVTKHHSFSESETARRIVSNCLVVDPRLRWDCERILQELNSLARDSFE